jgi:hypothetical protein
MESRLPDKVDLYYGAYEGMFWRRAETCGPKCPKACLTKVTRISFVAPTRHGGTLLLIHSLFSPLKLADCGSLDYEVILVSTFFVEK